MIAFAFSAALHDTLLRHSSVIMNNGKGYMFLGKSGTGKSTHSKLWYKYINGSDLLNDDNPAVRFFPENNKVFVYGTPWSGKTPCYRNLRVELGAVVRLKQYKENTRKREGKVGAFASILSSCSTMIWDKDTYNGICNTASAIAGITPVYYLRCRPDEEAARLSYNTIAQ